MASNGRVRPGRDRHGSPVWIADYTDPQTGKRRQLRHLTEDQAHETLRRVQLLQEGAPEPVPVRKGITMAEARRLSLSVRWAGRACETTAAGYSQDVVSFFGEATLLATINAREVERYRGHLKLKRQAAATINWKVSTLQSMLRDAVLYGHLDVMPALPTRLKLDNRKERTLSPEEVEGFRLVLTNHGHPEAADLLTFLVEVGCRWSEAETLTRAQVDVARGCVVFTKTKTGRPRTVPLTEKALAAVLPYLPATPSRRVWSYTYKAFQHQWDRAKGRLGLGDDLALTIHCCRHTSASRMASRGVNLQAVMAWHGWTSLQSAARYQHVDISSLEAVRAVVEA
jgi:integrase